MLSLFSLWVWSVAESLQNGFCEPISLYLLFLRKLFLLKRCLNRLSAYFCQHQYSNFILGMKDCPFTSSRAMNFFLFLILCFAFFDLLPFSRSWIFGFCPGTSWKFLVWNQIYLLEQSWWRIDFKTFESSSVSLLSLLQFRFCVFFSFALVKEFQAFLKIFIFYFWQWMEKVETILK